MRAIREDDHLRSTQKLVLLCAVLRMDNSTGRVRASHEILARDAAVSTKTISRAMADPRVRRFVEIVELKRGKNYTFRPSPLTVPATEAPKSTDNKSSRAVDHGRNVGPASGQPRRRYGQIVTDNGHPVGATGQNVHPSTISSTSSSTSYSSSRFNRPDTAYRSRHASANGSHGDEVHLPQLSDEALAEFEQIVAE
jgi:hypothetical protein